MANIKSINGNPIVVDASGIEDSAVTLAKLSAGMGAFVRRGSLTGAMGESWDGDWNAVIDAGAYLVATATPRINAPDTSAFGTLLVFNANAGATGVSRISQIFITSGGVAYFRLCTGATTWYEWSEISPKSYISDLGSLPTQALTDLNDVTSQGVYYIASNSTVANIPSTSAQRVVVLTTGSVITQMSFTVSMPFTIYIRSKRTVSDEWPVWRTLEAMPSTVGIESLTSEAIDLLHRYITIAHQSDLEPYGGVVAGLPRNSTILINSAWASDTPQTFSGTVLIFTFGGSSATSVHFQIAIQLSTCAVAMRYQRTNGTYGEWQIGSSESGHDTTAELWTFGDSIVRGQIGKTEAGQSVTNTDVYNYTAMAAKKLGMVAKNKAVGGTGVVANNAAINNMIDGFDMTNAKLIIVGFGGYNESGSLSTHDMGVYTDTTQESFVGYYYSLMAKLQSKCPQALVMYVSGFGAGLANGNQFNTVRTFQDGQHTWGEFYDELEKMCNLRGFPCINQHRVGSPINPLRNDWFHEGVIEDDPHFNEAGYKAYGNFLAAQIAARYANLA